MPDTFVGTSGSDTVFGVGLNDTRFERGETLFVEVEVDGAIDMAVRLQGQSLASQLTATDFVWLS
ncbi:MAG: hypothetical protein Kilf2KO_34180 [Rhodospirillales bacterium]